MVAQGAGGAPVCRSFGNAEALGAWSSDGAWRVNFLTQGAEMEQEHTEREGKTP